MNRFGAVIGLNGKPTTVQLRDWVVKEAMKAGWKLVPPENRDEGRVWSPPIHCIN